MSPIVTFALGFVFGGMFGILTMCLIIVGGDDD
jgi:hypothetical protein